MKSVIILILLSLQLVCIAQTDSISSPMYEFSFSIGTTSDGPANDFEHTLRVSGLDQPFPEFLEPGVNHPRSHTGAGGNRIPWIFSIAYKMNDEFNLGMSIGNSAIGNTSGFRLDAYKLNLQTIEYSLLEIAPCIILKMALLNLSCGPALFITKSNSSDSIGDFYTDSNIHLGFVMDASVQYPTESLFFGFAKIRSRILANDKLGPYKTRAIGSDVIHTIERFEVNYSSTYFGLGVGMRL